MKTQLGIAVRAREVHALLVQSGVISWHASAPIDSPESVGDATIALIEQAPPIGWHAQVTAAVSPAWVQVKQLHGLPAVKTRRIASELVRENQQAFFLVRGPVFVADVCVRKDGTTWGAAFDRDTVAALTSALRSKGIAVTRIVSSVAAIASALPARTLEWTDGENPLELEIDHDGVKRIERLQRDPTLPLQTLPEPLAALGDDARRFLDAYAAAIAPRNVPLSWATEPDVRRTRVLSKVRTMGVAFALCGAAMFAAFGPGVRAKRFTHAASIELAQSKARQLDVGRTEAELRRVTQVLNRVEAFRANRGRVTRLLGALSEALPESTAVLTFHVDSAEGGFTAIAPHIADVLPELVRVNQLVAPRIVGSVTRETMNGVHVERAAFRFRRTRPVATAVRTGVK